MRIYRPENEQPNDPELVAAVEAGDARQVGRRLAAGAYVDSTNATDHTGLMIAAVNGDREVFELLLDAGADPFLGHSDGGPTALDFAAMSGQAEVVDCWVRRGLEVSLADGVGNTPLMAAAGAGHLDVVRRLLEAGADVHARTVDGITALSVARHEQQHAVAAVLRNAGAGFDPNDPLSAEGAVLEPAGDPQAFRAVLQELQTALGQAGARWERHPDVYEFHVGTVDPPRLDQLRERVLAGGFHLVRSSLDSADKRDSLLLFPAADKYSIIRACGTDGGRCDLSTKQIVAWLRKLDRKHPFVLTGCGHDFVAGRFSSPVRDATRLAKAMHAFCPDVVDQGCGTVARLAEDLKRTQTFVLWWD